MLRASLCLVNLLAEKFVDADLVEPVHLLKKKGGGGELNMKNFFFKVT